jgi:hypothetical protein
VPKPARPAVERGQPNSDRNKRGSKVSDACFDMRACSRGGELIGGQGGAEQGVCNVRQ